MTFLLDLRDLVRWLDQDARALGKEDVIDGARVRALTLIHKFLAYPHCSNFSLMPEGA
jgi:hypothetical protein